MPKIVIKRRRKDVLVALRMDEDTHDFIAFVSDNTGLSRSAVIRQAVTSLRKLVIAGLKREKASRSR